ncbi:V-type ATP synthase subunit I [Anaerovorax sp. IOR16]|uniref:V-type ATP synthase subunit I n=1 Tax=Anaerovorax sp. IOR16 TaxID=2773458 RepID=UPI0019D164A9|nr:V-type ATP synthase subunit I [Anaerovorax sp. IOR16]
MAIVRMQKLSAIGLVSGKETLMEQLMKLGVVQLNIQDSKLNNEDWADLVSLDENDAAVAKIEDRMGKAYQALEAIAKYETVKKSLFHTRRKMQRELFQKLAEENQTVESQIGRINEAFEGITELINEANKIEVAKLALLPWKDYNLPLNTKGTKYCDLIRGVIPAAASLPKLQEAMEEKTPCYDLQLVASDAEQQYISLLYLKKEKNEIEDVLRQFGFSPSQGLEFEGEPQQAISAYEQQTEKIKEQIQELEKKIQKEQDGKHNIEVYYDSLAIKKDRALIRHRLLVTNRTFYLEGWTPKVAAEKVAKLLEENNCWFEITDPDKGEETPVLMQNGVFSAPFEAVTKLYALPDSRGIDPTPYFSFFYALFFGMMLSDAAYGLIIAAATFIILKKYPLEGMMGQLMKMFFYCGISTMFWGILFGGYFGDIVTVVAKTFFDADVVVPAVWFNPLDEPMKMLTFSFILGGIHLFLGMGVSGYMSIRDGRPWDALFDVGLWYILLIGLVLWLGGKMAALVGPTGTNIGMWMTIVGAVGILITGGRDKKGLGKLTGGLGSLYGITGYLADVLSYSRLLALGLATGVIASVINTLGSLAGGGIGGAILLTIVFVIGHAYNLSINALGSFVHSSRLQYVEFFGKFYESGGEAFQPFYENTKYVEISREEN